MFLRKLRVSDAEKIVLWNSNKDEFFLYQWAGKNRYTYPISINQIMKRDSTSENEIYIIDNNGEAIGVVELGWKTERIK